MIWPDYEEEIVRLFPQHPRNPRCWSHQVLTGNPVECEGVYAWYLDNAGEIYLCKKSLDYRLDNADDDQSLEPLAFGLLENRI